MKPLENMFCQGLHLSNFRIDPTFIVYLLGKSRPLNTMIAKFAYIFIRVSKCDKTNDFVVVSVEVNQRHVLEAESLNFL